MKKLLKILGILVILAIAGIISLLAYVKIGLPNVAEAPDLKIELTPERITHGKHLYTNVMGCDACHSGRDWTRFGAPFVEGTRGTGGKIWSEKDEIIGELIAPNITPTGIGDWTDGEIFRAMTSGVTRDGRAMFPIMPYTNYATADKEDILDVIAYIRTLEPAGEIIPPRELGFPLNFIVNTIPADPKFTGKPNPANKVKYGEYLVKMASCSNCHTPQEKGQHDMTKYMAGGFDLHIPQGTCTSANITPHKENGIGSWTEEMFVSKFKQYADSSFKSQPTGTKGFNTEMPWLKYSQMSEDELSAIYTYLMTLDPIDQKIQTFAAK